MRVDPDALRDVVLGKQLETDDFVAVEVTEWRTIAWRLSQFFALFIALLFLSALVPPPFIEQRHIRPGWSLQRPHKTVIATRVTGVSSLNHKIRLYIRFIDRNRSTAPRLGTPIRIFASKAHELVSEIVSSVPISDPSHPENNSQFYCVFESVLVNFDTCYFRAEIQGRIPEFVEVKWSIIRTFFASFELTFSLAFASILSCVIGFRLFNYSRCRFQYWERSQKMTINLSICILVYDLFGFIPTLFIPSFFSLALGEIVRSLVRAFSVFYLLFTFNPLPCAPPALKAVFLFIPVAFAVLFFSLNAVFLISLIERDMDHAGPAEYDSRSPVHFLILALLAGVAVWILLLVLWHTVIGGRKRQLLVSAVALAPLLACFFICEVWVHDLRRGTETAVTYSAANGAINLFCLLAEYAQWPTD
jgi:hypothetical protein